MMRTVSALATTSSSRFVIALAVSFLSACGSSGASSSPDGDGSGNGRNGSNGGGGASGGLGGSGSGGAFDGGIGGGGGALDSGAEDQSSPPASDGGPSPGAGCMGTPTWSPGDSKTIAITFGNQGARSYDVYVGKNVKPGTPVPLLVNVHGLTNSPALQAQFSQMNPVADQKGFVVVYPAGLNASFNAGSCCGQSASSGVDDVGFIRAIVADAESKICIDQKRVYQTGFSNGGMMSYQLACHAADLFAAMAPTEGSDRTTPPCNPSRPVPLAAFQYLADPTVTAATAQSSVQAWAHTTGCADASPTRTTVSGFTCDEWSQCQGGAHVRYCTMPGGTHYPPVGSAPVIWSFLSQFTLL